MAESQELNLVELQTIQSSAVSASSINSTQAIAEVDRDKLNDNESTQLPTEQELKPELAQFMTACQQGNLHLVKEAIESKHVTSGETFTDGITGLHWAAINNRMETVKYFVENTDIDVNVFGGELQATPLHWACRNGLVNMVNYLVNHGADPTLRDSQAYNALHLSVHSSNIMLVIYILYKCCGSNGSIYVDETDSSNRTSLHWACYQGDILTVQALLKFGADVNKVDDGLFVPLHWSFMKAYKPLLKVLVEHGSDLFAKNDQGKSSFDVARDMNCLDLWVKALNELNRHEKDNWQVSKSLFGDKTSKLIVFFTPYVVLPIMFKINSFNHGFMIPKLFLTGLMMVPIAYVLKNFVIKGIVPDRSLLKSPLSSGIFSGTLFWAILSFCFEVFPIVAFKSFRLFIHSLLLAACIVVISYSFYKSMVLNPGLVPITTDQTKIMAQIHELIKINRFNPDNFCVNMLVRKPLRSKYSHYNKRLIARFDHFCPWVYNEIGVRNHKIFIFFIYSLNLGIFLYSTLVLSYFKYAKPQLETRDGYDSDDEGECLFFDDEMCKGFINFNFTFNLMVWCCFQFVWVSFLSLTQTFQIVKGLTTYEFATLSSPGSLGEPKNPFKVCLKLLGIDQFMLSAKMSIMSLLNRNVDDFQNIESDIPSDYGVKQNWLDFWVLGDIKFRNVFYLPLEGENNLNGQLVDYYTLYDYPSKSPSQLA